MNILKCDIQERNIRLERLTYCVQCELRDQGLYEENSCIDYDRYFANQLVARLKYELAKQSNTKRITKVFNQNIKHEIEIQTKYPSSIWQMIKTFLPLFIQKTFPIKYKTCNYTVEKNIPITFECEVGVDIVYPDIILPKDNYPVNFRFMDGNKFTIPKEYIE